jgi:hypothetical protein
MTFGIGRRLGSPRAGLIGCWLVATSPAVLLMLMSAITLVYWHCYRRDDTSPRRVGRRI